jgi:AraC-like DNA-binding protein
MIVSLTSVLISIYLFKQPELLYGSDFENQHINITKNRILTQIKFSNKDYLSQTSKIENLDNLSVNSNEFYRIKNKLEKHFHNDKPYLNQNFCLDDLVRSISIPRYLISATINKEYGISFRELVNLYRIEFLLSNLDKQEWQNLTWEAISEEAGFKSRFTFIKNFKQITGMTPSEYNKFKP